MAARGWQYLYTLLCMKSHTDLTSVAEKVQWKCMHKTSQWTLESSLPTVGTFQNKHIHRSVFGSADLSRGWQRLFGRWAGWEAETAAQENNIFRLRSSGEFGTKGVKRDEELLNATITFNSPKALNRSLQRFLWHFPPEGHHLLLLWNRYKTQQLIFYERNPRQQDRWSAHGKPQMALA